MCGIFGIINPNVQSKRENLEKMSKVLYHRGPDENQVHLFENAALGHTRLTIIDLVNGSQPMITPNKKIGLTFNGEIYGFKEIRSQLKYKFQTTSDTEIILALYQKFGIKCLEKLPGMFSFGLWDDESQSLFCARDRFGEKPFYYAQGISGEFIFASEIKSILASGLVNPTINSESLKHYLKRLYVHPYKTIYSNIHCLPPAHFLIYHHSKIKIKQYWNFPDLNESISLPDAIDNFKFLFDQAVKKQLVADVPVGAFVSGGLDSSSIIDAASNHNSNIKTFSFGFMNAYNNELPYAKAVADKYGTDHHELIENINDLSELIIKMQQIYDEPFADSSNIPTYLLSKLASQNVKVVLAGDGGDEMLAGYSFWYSDINKIQNYLSQSTGYLTKFCELLPDKMISILPEKYNNILEGKRLYGKYGSIRNLYQKQRDYFNSKDLLEFGLSDESENVPDHIPRGLDDVLRLDINNYLPGDLLVKIDRASMANSLEVRSPFLDIDLASFCISLPHRLKINYSKDKLILREAFSKRWPKEIRTRKKMGFGAPINSWLQKKEMISLKKEYLLDKNKKIYSYLDYNKSKEFIDKFNYQEWILLSFSLWLEHKQSN